MKKIYIIQVDGNGPIKIGISVRPHGRISAIQASNHVALNLLAIIDGDIKTERHLHRKFGKFHLRGEWFKPGKELLDFISSLPTPAQRKENERFTLANDPKVVEIWFDKSIESDVEAAKLIGRDRSTIKVHLGPSGRRGISRERAVAYGKLGGRPKKKRTDKHIAQKVWLDLVKYPKMADALAHPDMKGWSQSAATRRPPKGLGPRGALAGRHPKPR